MANEIQVRASVSVRLGNLKYQSPQPAWTAALTTAIGPTPGAVTIPLEGRDFFFEELTSPGIAVFTNIDATNFVRFGLYILDLDRFFPIGRIYPGESFPFRFDPDLFQAFLGSGTSAEDGEAYFRFKADTAPVVVQIDAFEGDGA